MVPEPTAQGGEKKRKKIQRKMPALSKAELLQSTAQAKRKEKQERRNKRRWTVVELKITPPTANSYTRYDWEEVKRAVGVSLLSYIVRRTHG